MTRLLSLLLGLTLVAVPACGGDDDGGGTDGDDDIDAGGGDDPDGGGDDTPDAGTPDAFVLPTAAEFCALWGDTCTFGEGTNYDDVEDCETQYEGFDDERKGCVYDHWVFAEAAVDGSQDEDDHCGHSSGNPPCN